MRVNVLNPEQKWIAQTHLNITKLIPLNSLRLSIKMKGHNLNSMIFGFLILIIRLKLISDVSKLHKSLNILSFRSHKRVGYLVLRDVVFLRRVPLFSLILIDTILILHYTVPSIVAITCPDEGQILENFLFTLDIIVFNTALMVSRFELLLVWWVVPEYCWKFALVCVGLLVALK